MSIDNCILISLPKIVDARGNLSFIEGKKHIDFEIKRVYYLYDVPTEAQRGGHAHKELKQFLICLSGSFKVILDDGKKKKEVYLNKPNVGLYIPVNVWRELEDFSSGAVCLVLASDYYREEDYYRNYDKFIEAVKI